MTPFLYKVAEVFYAQYGNELYRHTFVFPNRRAGVFFRKYLAEIAGKPLFSPSVITIQELFETLSSYQPADRIEMLVMLYDHFGKISGSDESFDDFLYWGEMLLNDFNDADKYLVDARQLFRNVNDFRSLDDDWSHLTENQINAVRRFWTNFMPVEGNEAKQKFQETWKVLYELYSTFRAALHEKGRAYEGMMFREVAERVKAKEETGWHTEGFIFVGLNALTPSETLLLEHLKNAGIADFYWDYESPFVHDTLNRASLWVKENLARFPSKFTLKGIDGGIKIDGDAERTTIFSVRSNPGKFSENINSEDINKETEKVNIEEDEDTNIEGIEKVNIQEAEKTKIEVVGIPSGVGQAKHVTRILSELIQSNEIPDPNEAINTAIVLPDENLLLPVLIPFPKRSGR
jgi:hypothetical protein